MNRTPLFFLGSFLSLLPLRSQETWSLATSPTTVALHGASWGAGRFVAVGDGGVAVTSVDGARWELAGTGTTNALRGVTYGGGRFVAVGESGTIVASADGLTWELRTSGSTQTLGAISYGNGRFLAVGDGVGARAFVSSDGNTWSAATIAGSDALRAVTFAYSQFVLVGDRGALALTPNGTGYTVGLAGTSETLRGITYGHRQFLAVGGGGTVLVSPDGLRYRSPGGAGRIATGDLRGVTFSQGTFIAVGDAGTILTSDDSERWTRRMAGEISSRLNAIAVSPVDAVAVGDNGTIVRAHLSPRAPAIVRQPPSTTAAYAQHAVALNVIAAGSEPLAYQWTHQGRTIAGATKDILLLENLSFAEIGDYSVSVTNALGSVASANARLEVAAEPPNNGRPPPLIEPGFTLGATLSPTPVAAVELSDGRILVGGAFTTTANGTAQTGLLVLNADGAIDRNTTPLSLDPSGRVSQLIAQPDGKILVVGEFTAVNGLPRRNLARLLASGTVDPAFNVSANLSIPGSARLQPLSNGATLVAGIGDGTKLYRLGSDGSIDSSFPGQITAEGTLPVIKNSLVDAAGRILVVGVSANGTFLARLLADGRPDATYANFSFGAGADVPLLGRGENGRILYVRLGATLLPSVGSLDADGATDGASVITTSTSAFRAASQAADGRLLLATWITAGRSPSALLVRFRADGQLDATFEFNANADGEISGLAPLRNGQTLILGGFNRVDGMARAGVARLLAFNRAISGSVIIADMNSGSIQVREGEPFKLRANAGNSPFSGVRWIDETGMQAGNSSGLFSYYGDTSFDYVRQDAGTFYLAASIFNLASQIPVRSPFVRIDVSPQPDPVILAQPRLEFGSLGVSSPLVVSAAGKGIAYQWMKNGVAIVGATSHRYQPFVPLDFTARYTVVITNARGSVTSVAARLDGSAPVAGRLINLAVRTSVGAGDRALIVGYVVGGAGAMGSIPLLIRGVGPTLAGFGVTDALSDPRLDVFGPGGGVPIATNDNWGNPLLEPVTARVGAFPLTGAASKDAALMMTASVGAYTAQLSPADSGSGTALAEIYDASDGTPGVSAPRLVNVSARAQVGTGGGILIAGFTLNGEVARTLLIRAIGPTLGSLGVTGALANPRLEVYASGASTPQNTNDDWGTAANAAQIATTSAAIGAFPLNADSRDAVVLVSLAPGSYTAQVSGVGNTTGNALVEIYEVPNP